MVHTVAPKKMMIEKNPDARASVRRISHSPYNQAATTNKILHIDRRNSITYISLNLLLEDDANLIIALVSIQGKATYYYINTTAENKGL